MTKGQRTKLAQLKKRIAKGKHWEPRVGDLIYAPTALYIDRGEDDFEGGLCTIRLVVKLGVASINNTMVELSERPGVQTNWHVLLGKQKELMKEHKNKFGYSNPDL